MTTIREGRVSWTFEDDWLVSKYDDWSYYRNQFQAVAGGTKAVDILALEPKVRVLWMIEAKDHTSERRDASKPDLWQEVAQKARDTLAGVMAAACRECDEREVAKILREATKIRVVLHIEQPTQPSRLFPRSFDPADLRQKLTGSVSQNERPSPF